MVPPAVVEIFPVVVMLPPDENVPEPIVTVVVPFIAIAPPVLNVVVPINVALVNVSPLLERPMTVTLVKSTVEVGLKVQVTPERPALIEVAVRVPKLSAPEES